MTNRVLREYMIVASLGKAHILIIALGLEVVMMKKSNFNFSLYNSKNHLFIQLVLIECRLCCQHCFKLLRYIFEEVDNAPSLVSLTFQCRKYTDPTSLTKILRKE